MWLSAFKHQTFRQGENIVTNRNHNIEDVKFRFLFFQEYPCSPKKLQCINNITIDISKCLKPCSGFIVTSFSKAEMHANEDNLLYIYGPYNDYKKITQYPSGYSGKYLHYYIKPMSYFTSISHLRLCMEEQPEICENIL